MDVAIRIVEQRKESGLPLPGACNTDVGYRMSVRVRCICNAEVQRNSSTLSKEIQVRRDQHEDRVQP